MLKIVSAVALDAANLTGRVLGAALAGVEEALIKAHTRRGVLAMTIGEMNAATEAGTLTYRQMMQAVELQAKINKLDKQARR